MSGSLGPFPILGEGSGSELEAISGPVPRIETLLVKPASAHCNLDCEYCFYLRRESDPYPGGEVRRMSLDTLERLIDAYLFYSYPAASLAFQGGEPTLCGLTFFERLVEYEQRYGRPGQTIANSIQTNGLLIDENWCRLFREYKFLVGLSIDGPEEAHDRHRIRRTGAGSWRQVLRAVELLQRENVSFNALCVLSTANIGRPRELYEFFRNTGIRHVQFIPLAEFDNRGDPLPFTPSPEQYGHFLCELFELWWPNRSRMSIRFFDNLAEALAGQVPSDCTLRGSCTSYCVVEYNGDVYPCDFFVESGWRLGNIHRDSWAEIARRARRANFGRKKNVPHRDCEACRWRNLCQQGCPRLRMRRFGRFEDLDYYCAAYKMAFERVVKPLEREVRYKARSR